MTATAQGWDLGIHKFWIPLGEGIFWLLNLRELESPGVGRNMVCRMEDGGGVSQLCPFGRDLCSGMS